MKRFCKDVLKFLESEYNNSYMFEIEYRSGLHSENDTVELTIISDQNYKRTFTYDIMFVIFGWYCNGAFIEERNQFRWQKELIDIIEGS